MRLQSALVCNALEYCVIKVQGSSGIVGALYAWLAEMSVISRSRHDIFDICSIDCDLVSSTFGVETTFWGHEKRSNTTCVHGKFQGTQQYSFDINHITIKLRYIVPVI